MWGGMSAFTGRGIPTRSWDSQRPRFGSKWLASIVAMPEPHTSPPIIWERAVRSLTTAPTL
ncbi:hypothetical protein GCM10027162_44520 [Streptomyces incanus]